MWNGAKRVHKFIQVNNEPGSNLDGGFDFNCVQIIYQSDAVYTGLVTPLNLGIGPMGWGPRLICRTPSLGQYVLDAPPTL